MNTRIFILCCFLLGIAAGCKKTDKTVYEVPEEAEVYVQGFISEAKARGRDIQIDNLVVKFKKGIRHDGVAYFGCSKTGKNGQNIIWIDTERYCWTFGGYYRESLMFHELAHTFLLRGHEDGKLPEGSWRSLMSTGDLDHYAPDSLIFKRQYYLDELFDINTPSPWWGK